MIQFQPQPRDEKDEKRVRNIFPQSSGVLGPKNSSDPFSVPSMVCVSRKSRMSPFLLRQSSEPPNAQIANEPVVRVPQWDSTG
jgi:hypothetical protein